MRDIHSYAAGEWLAPGAGARNIASDTIAPVFLTSSVTGEGLDHLRSFLNMLPQRFEWFSKLKEEAEFIIDETFAVPGVGTVVAGTRTRDEAERHLVRLLCKRQV